MGEGHCLGADAAACFEHRASRRINRVAVQEVDQRPRLIVKPFVLAWMVAVHINLAHDFVLILLLAR